MRYSDFYPRSPCGERRPVKILGLHFLIISIHALLAESDLIKLHGVQYITLFLSTLSLRRATSAIAMPASKRNDFYPRSPCGERHECWTALNHLLRFLSTLSLRRATHYDNYNLHCVEISIHALLAESDAPSHNPCSRSRNFYPRSPCGERQKNALISIRTARISIHALLAESDLMMLSMGAILILFLSTLSLRRATADSVSQWTAT